MSTVLSLKAENDEDISVKKDDKRDFHFLVTRHPLRKAKSKKSNKLKQTIELKEIKEDPTVKNFEPSLKHSPDTNDIDGRKQESRPR
jgi:hypothetical protein